MKKELENKLAVAFPFMKQKKSLTEQMATGHINDLYSAFGCEVGDGWFSLIYQLCSEIMNSYKLANLPIDINVLQVKEKFGTLRFYYNFDNQDKKIQAIDFLEQTSIRIQSKDTPIHKEIADIVKKYEKMSNAVCEECGQAGRLRDDLSWVLTLCDDCYKKRKTN